MKKHSAELQRFGRPLYWGSFAVLLGCMAIVDLGCKTTSDDNVKRAKMKQAQTQKPAPIAQVTPIEKHKEKLAEPLQIGDQTPPKGIMPAHARQAPAQKPPPIAQVTPIEKHKEKLAEPLQTEDQSPPKAIVPVAHTKTSHKRTREPEEYQTSAPLPRGLPTITYIGQRPIFGIVPGQDFEIAIHGSDLFQSQLAWSVEVGGTRPATRGVDYELKTYADNPEDPSVSLANATIVLRSNYTARLHDKDSIVIDASILQVDDQSIREALQSIRNLESAVTNTAAQISSSKFDSQVSSLAAIQASVIPQVNLVSSDSAVALVNSFQNLPEKGEDETTARIKLASILQNLRSTRESLARKAGTLFPTRTSGTGTFQVYTVDTYRQKFQESTFELFEIKAYPLPEKMAAEILGTKVAKHYYVVALSLKNTSTQDRVVNSGLISAWGKALVCPANSQIPVYSKPITVSPDSLQQVYSAVATSKWNTTREWIFRTLEFGGGLSTAIATGFRGTPDLIKALGVYTGVGIPGLQQLWPDQVPNYLANIVNFGMPELIKIPHGASQGYQLLFFSKDSLDAQIPDPSQFDAHIFPDLHKDPMSSPRTFVVYLSFDTMVVPYDLGVQSSGTNTLAITTGPVSTTNAAGSSASFFVIATGAGKLSYQWYFGNAPLPESENHIGTTTSTLILNALQANDQGAYKVSITDSTGATVTSGAASLTVTSPAVAISPVKPTETAGANISFTATVTGFTAATYQWSFNGKNLTDAGNISGSTTSVLNLKSLQKTDAGTYKVTATDSTGKLSPNDSTVLTVNP